MNNINLEEQELELTPVGTFNIESVLNFFNIKEGNRKLLTDALSDIAG